MKKKMSMFSVLDIKKIVTGIFAVPSCSIKNVHHMVDISFCKHQCLVSAHMSIVMMNSPTLISTKRHNLAATAFGKNCPPLYFIDFATQIQTAIKENSDNINDSSSCPI